MGLAIPMSFWTLDNIARIFEILEAVAVIVGAVVAVFTINAWRRENLGKRKLEIAEQALLAFYDYKQRVIDLRRPLAGPTELDPVQSFQLNRSQYWNRLGILGMPGITEPLLNLKPQFQVYFGFEATKPFDLISRPLAALQGALCEVFTHIPANGSTPEPLPKTLEILGWSTLSRPDQIDLEMNRAVKEMEKICEPVLQGRK